MTVASVREFSGMGMYLAFASALLVAFALIHARREPGRGHAAAGGAAAGGRSAADSAADERALPVSGGHAGLCLRKRHAAAGDCHCAGIVSLCSYMEAIFSFTVIPMNVLSLLAIACAAALALELMGKLGIKGAQIGESDA